MCALWGKVNFPISFLSIHVLYRVLVPLLYSPLTRAHFENNQNIHFSAMYSYCTKVAEHVHFSL